MNGLSKFDELRIKTDRQLLQLLNNELDGGLGAACETLGSADDPAFTKERYVKAKRAYTEVLRLMRVAYEITEDERNRLESRLNRLRRILEGLAGLRSMITPGEKDIAALARVLWEARGCPQGSPQEDWFRAERNLKSRSASAAREVQRER